MSAVSRWRSSWGSPATQQPLRWSRSDHSAAVAAGQDSRNATGWSSCVQRSWSQARSVRRCQMGASPYIVGWVGDRGKVGFRPWFLGSLSSPFAGRAARHHFRSGDSRGQRVAGNDANGRLTSLLSCSMNFAARSRPWDVVDAVIFVGEEGEGGGLAEGLGSVRGFWFPPQPSSVTWCCC